MSATDLDLLTKRCPKCGDTKALTAFYRDRNAVDGRSAVCGACTRRRVLESQERRRREMGEEAWLANRAEITRRSRKRTGNVSGKRYGATRRAATAALIERHRREFDHLVLLASRGELDAAP